MTDQRIPRSKTAVYLISGVVVGVGLIIAAMIVTTFWIFSECGPFTPGRIGDVQKDRAYTLTPPQVKLTYEGKEACTHSTSVVSTEYAGVYRTYEFNGASPEAVRSFYKSELQEQGWKYEEPSLEDIPPAGNFNDFYSKKIDNGKELQLSIIQYTGPGKPPAKQYAENITVF